jgi:hypothetical protein
LGLSHTLPAHTQNTKHTCAGRREEAGYSHGFAHLLG